MDCLRSSALGGVEDALDREVALSRRSRPEEESLVRIRDVKRGAVALGVDRIAISPRLATRTFSNMRGRILSTL